MDFAAEKYQKDLPRIKDNVKDAYLYFEKNYKRFNDFKRMVFVSSLTQNDKELLKALERPVLEFNILEAYVSRILGELYQQKPAVAVSANNPDNVHPQVVKFIEMHLRSVFEDRTNKHKIYEIAKDILAGGFSAAHVYTDYTSEMSMQQMINFDRVFDPTLCGWDPAAQYSHKGDGQFCFEIIPKTKEEAKALYPKLATDYLSYSKGFEGFKWSYKSGKKDMILIVDYYEKKKRRKKIVQLSDGRILFKDEWKKEQEKYNNPFEMFMLKMNNIYRPIVVKERFTVIETICLYRICENKVLEFEETDYKLLPIIFIDGNSIKVQSESGDNTEQVTRPFVYHALGAQRLKNTSGIALANEIENTVQHKFMIKEEALPEDPNYLEGWTQYQKPSLMVYKGYLDNNPDQPISDPVSPVARVNAPQEVTQAFVGADSLVQNILGSYDASLGINNNQLSGKAIEKGALHSNSVVMPFIAGLMDGLQRIAQVYISLVPKYYKTPVTLPYLDDKGNRKYVKLAPTDDVLNFDDNVLNVTVEAGPSFRVQKEQTIKMVKELMGVSEQFAAFVNAKGLDFILDNMEGHGIEQLKQMADEWMKEQEAKQAQQPNPQQMAMQEQQQKQQLEQQKLALEEQKIKASQQLEMLKLQFEKQKQEIDLMVAQQKNNTELERQEDKQKLEEMKMQLDMFKEMMQLKVQEMESLDVKKKIKEEKNE